MQNWIQYYERNYPRLQDVLGDIGGFYSVIFTFVEVLIILVSKYIFLLDTENVILESANFYDNTNNITNRQKIDELINYQPLKLKKSRKLKNKGKVFFSSNKSKL